MEKGNWGQRVADFIHKKISGREELVCADALDKITKICLKTVEDLNIILMKLDEFQTNILPVDQNKQIEEWHKREVIRDILELQKYPSIIKYIAGRRDDNKEVVKVYLSEDNEDAKNVFVRCCKVSKDTIFEFVNVEKWKQSQKNDEIKGTERKPRSVDNSERKELLQIIRKYRKKIYARHSNVIGIRIGNVIQKRDLIQEKTCIILYCLDKTLIPFGEKPLPDSIEGWPCDVREDFFMLGTCPKNCPSTNKDFPELGCSIGMHSKNGSGSVGFLYESIKYGSGFLTASHVAIANCHELHVDNSLLSNHPLGKETHLIVHPSWSDNKKSNRTVGKVVESFYGEYKLSEELYEGLDFAAVKTDHCRVGDKDEMAVINTDDLTYTEMVKKTGRSTGTTYGYLDEDIMFATIEYPPLSGTMNDFPELYIVKDIPETPPFFRKGDSGSGVFVMGNQVKPLGIGIAFSEQSSETYVCKINEIVKRLGLTLVKYREGKQNQTSPDTQEKTANEITDMHI